MKLYNTASRSIEEFTHSDSSPVTIYTCGPTVYSEPHIGNWVAYLRWDLLVRVLQADGYIVKRVMNITDVGHLTSDADDGEDKMEKGARREGITAWDVAQRYTKSFIDGMSVLDLIPPSSLAPATEFIEDQIKLIATLEGKGHTYRINDGIYFDTSTFERYADFAHLDIAALKSGARVQSNPEKRNITDFALWKFSPDNANRDMEWDSPWGVGFPGWHIECSSIAQTILGDTIDIHTGGIDHIPIHHTNEIAQSEAASGKPFARFWLHANFLLSEGTKISKSLDNGYTLRDLRGRGFSPMDFKMFILQSNYRSETNFTWDNLGAAQNRLNRWRSIAELRWQLHDTLDDDDQKDELHDVNGRILAAPHAALESLRADLNSPAALISIEDAFDAIEASNTSHVQHAALSQLISSIDDYFGLQLEQNTPDIDESAKQTILARQRARENKDWELSDSLRDGLVEQGIYLKDTGSRSLWSRYKR